MCRVFDMSKVKVPVIFSGTEGFPPRRDGRYLILIKMSYPSFRASPSSRKARSAQLSR